MLALFALGKQILITYSLCLGATISSLIKKPPFLPKFSSDWRFLSGIPTEGKALVVINRLEDLNYSLSSSFHCPIFLIQQPEFSAIAARDLKPFADDLICVQADLLYAPFPNGVFDVVAIPNGFPDGQTLAGRKMQEAHMHAACRLTKPGGVLYASFANLWDFHRLHQKTLTSGPHSTPSQISQLLKKFGYTSVTIYGAIRDHKIPLYIFPLEPNIVGFVARRHYGRKLPRFLANLLAKRFVAMGLKYILPSYMVVAKAKCLAEKS